MHRRKTGAGVKRLSVLLACAGAAGMCLTGCTKEGGISASKIFFSGEILSVDREEETVTVRLSDSGDKVTLDFAEATGVPGEMLTEGWYLYYTTWGSTPEEIEKIERTAPFSLNCETASGEVLSADTVGETLTVCLEEGSEFYGRDTVTLDCSRCTNHPENYEGTVISYEFFDGKPEEIYSIIHSEKKEQGRKE